MKSNIFNHKWAVIGLCVIILAVSCKDRRGEVGAGELEAVEQMPNRLGFEPDTLDVVEGKVKQNEYFSNLVIRLGMDASEAYLLAQACDTVFNVRKLRSGNPFKAYYTAADSSAVANGDGRELEYIVYERDVVTDVVFKCTAPYKVWISGRSVIVEDKYADVTIETSLWNDMVKSGASPMLVLKLSDIYAWTVDFFGLRQGDRFRVYYDERSCEGKILDIDTVRYAVYIHGEDEFPVIMFNQGDGGNIYWNDKGESVQKQLLKAPLHFSRISSGFSYSRKHPVTRRVQPHTGVDYAAPTGTPVVSVGDGVVISMKHEGAGGNTIRIKHNSVYTTAYLHLSKFAAGLKPGKSVHQGDVIGYVGATGRCTGPHLDYRIWKNGTPVNPLTLESPPSEPLKEENRTAFDSLRVSWENVL